MPTCSIHDAMHADHDYDLRRGWGHSPARAGVVVAERAGAKKLALFHHSPDATDDMIDDVVKRDVSAHESHCFRGRRRHVPRHLVETHAATFLVTRTVRAR